MYSTIYSAMRLFWKGGLDIRRHLHELEKTQWMSPSELQGWKFARIRALVGYAYENVPYYQKRYRGLGIHPGDINTWTDFEKLPFLTREDVQKHLEELVAPEWRSRAQPNSTSGSTGQPMQFYMEDSYHWWDWALELRGRGWYGVGQGDKVALVWGAQRDIQDQTRRARLRSATIRERYLNAYGMTKHDMEEFGRMLLWWHPPLIRGYPSALSLFAEYLREHGIPVIRPRVIETTAEKLTDGQRSLIEDVFRCKIADWYTNREFGTIAYQCPEGGLHVCETRHLEVIEGGKVAQPGELGEIAVTSLHQFAMPFIRYKTGDMALYQLDLCSCGRGLPMLQEIAGRRQEILVTADGKLVYSGFITHAFRDYPGIARFQVHQPDRSHLFVRLVVRPTTDPAWLERLRAQLQDRFGQGMRISIEIVDEIRLTDAGKLRPIISDVEPVFL